jgi:hypothetical protein
MNTTFMRVVKQGEFYLRRNAPTILTTAGVIGFVATTAVTVRSTVKAIEHMPNIKKRVEEARASEGSEKEKSQELAKVYAASTIVLAKDFAPTLVLGTSSILLVAAGHRMMLRRQASLAVLYAALDSSYRAYRKRVADKIGVEDERDLYHRPTMRALDEVDGLMAEEGSAPVYDMSDVQASPYSRFFDESNPNFRKTPEYNKFFLKNQETWANERLRAYGYLFLNEVYQALGMERSQSGQVVGWRLDGNGDGFVSFGIENIWDENNRAFVNGIEPVVLLDFNVDGPIIIK